MLLTDVAPSKGLGAVGAQEPPLSVMHRANVPLEVLEALNRTVANGALLAPAP